MFDYDVNIRKIHEICNKTYKKKTDLGIRYEINRSAQVCHNCQCYLNISLILTKSSILASALSICSSTIFRLYLKNSL